MTRSISLRSLILSAEAYGLPRELVIEMLEEQIDNGIIWIEDGLVYSDLIDPDFEKDKVHEDDLTEEEKRKAIRLGLSFIKRKSN